MKIVITGFMGAGKTTLQEEWKDEFPGSSSDLDHLIAKNLKISPQQLGQWIEENGFPEFRKIESETLQKCLEGKETLLLALGGGAFTSENRELIQKCGAKSIWINTDPEVCWERVKEDTNRPLVKKGKEGFFSLYKDREGLYKKADFTISGTYPVPTWDEFCKSYNLMG